jgi:hypothetical protein
MQKHLETPLELPNLVALWEVESFPTEQAWSICKLTMTSDELASYFASQFRWQKCASGDQLE